MAKKLPQIDFPRGIVLRGGAEIWDTRQAGAILIDDMFEYANTTVTVSGVNLYSQKISVGDSVVQTHHTSSDNVFKDVILSSSNILQTHSIHAVSTDVVVTLTQNSASQIHQLQVQNPIVENISGDAPVKQNHVIYVNAVFTSTTSTSDQIYQDHTLKTQNSVSLNESSGEGVTQIHKIYGENFIASNTSAEGDVTTEYVDIILSGENLSVENTCTVTLVSQTHEILSDTSTVSYTLSNGRVNQDHTLYAENLIHCGIVDFVIPPIGALINPTHKVYTDAFTFKLYSTKMTYTTNSDKLTIGIGT